VAPHTICRWFDSGRLGGYRDPGNGARRIPHGELLHFLTKYNLPTVGLEEWDRRTNDRPPQEDDSAPGGNADPVADWDEEFA
jgi:hypothetical protein